jgi:CDP-glycerol glycerophosphotransferase (TagB/SpsB family)
VTGDVSPGSRFTFAAGNLRKILAIPLYGLGNLATWFVRRRDDLWVVGSGIGVGEGALALVQHARGADPRLRIIWMARDQRDMRAAEAAGFAAVRKGSWRGFQFTLRARVAIVTHGFGDVNRYGVRGAFVVQLWHGIPFKHLHIDSPEALRLPLIGNVPAVRRALRWAYARSGRRISMFVAASAVSARRLKTAFALEDRQFCLTGDPRDDAVFGSEQTARRKLAGLTGDERFLTSRIILYAPTWRDGEDDPAIPTDGERQVISQMLDHTDSILLTRSHPLGAGDYAANGWRMKSLPVSRLADITPLLPAIDVLVTDYSSIAFDFALLGRPIVFFAPDLAVYTARHGTYEPYDSMTDGTAVTTWHDAAANLATLEADPVARQRASRATVALAARLHRWQDGANTARTYEELRRRLRGEAGQHVLGEPSGPAPEDAAALRIDTIRLTDDARELLLAGDIPGPGTPRSPQGVSLLGHRARVDAPVIVEGRRWRASLPLRHSRWSGPALPPPSGTYRLVFTDGKRECSFGLAPGVVPREHTWPGVFHLRWAEDGRTLTLGAPLGDDERGAGQARLETRYRRERGLQDSIFFESFYGRNASCNPRGIDRAVAAIRPDITRYWSVADASVPVPDGAVPLIEGTTPWWEARARSRALVVNDWLRKRYRSRRGQTVLQTWHGTPLKRIAMLQHGLRLHARLATYREQARWDVMLAQNPFSASAFRSAYGFRRQIWQEGYPRNDILIGADGQAVRTRLGIPPGLRVVLYAPTWRDDRPGQVDHLQAATFARQLGEGYVTLVRGHSRTLLPGSDVTGERVMDVTGYPDTAELLLAADLVITDYSSIMFDVTVTGKPVFFFVPDFDAYRDRLRGFTFDLLPLAPGPVLTDRAELVDAVRHADDIAPEFAERYSRWRARFNPRDDGHAGERVVLRMIREGML